MAYRTNGAGYADVAAHFRKAIENGELSPGDALPSVGAIREHFEVSAKTVSRALKVLKSEGLVTSKGSLGTVVADRAHVASTGVARLDRLNRTGQHYAPGESSTDHVAMTRSCADADIAAQLDVELHDEIVIRRRVFRQDGRPTVVALSCIHTRALADVPELLQQGQLKPFWAEDVHREDWPRDHQVSGTARRAAGQFGRTQRPRGGRASQCGSPCFGVAHDVP
jgi:DNA-binding GntR family transcriptional regulator